MNQRGVAMPKEQMTQKDIIIDIHTLAKDIEATLAWPSDSWYPHCIYNEGSLDGNTCEEMGQ